MGSSAAAVAQLLQGCCAVKKKGGTLDGINNLTKQPHRSSKHVYRYLVTKYVKENIFALCRCRCQTRPRDGDVTREELLFICSSNVYKSDNMHWWVLEWSSHLRAAVYSDDPLLTPSFSNILVFILLSFLLCLFFIHILTVVASQRSQREHDHTAFDIFQHVTFSGMSWNSQAGNSHITRTTLACIAMGGQQFWYAV